MVKKPYIGFVGISSEKESKKEANIIKDLDSSCKKIGRLAQLGVKINQKVIERLDYGKNKRLPGSLGELRRIFEYAKDIVPDILNVVHYSPQKNEEIISFMRNIYKTFFDFCIYEDGLCRAVQFNGCLMRDRFVRQLKLIKETSYPEMTVILQINGVILDNLSKDEIIDELEPISHLVNYVLFNTSGGRWLSLENRHMFPKIIESATAVSDAFPNIGIGFSGGLDYVNVGDVVKKIRKNFGRDDFSIDVESGLRVKLGPEYGNDLFDESRAKKFFKQSINAFL